MKKKKGPQEAPKLLEVLPEKLREGGPLPLGYYMMRAESAASGAPVFRAARSDIYRSVASHCIPFYKPISRCIKIENQ